MFKTKIKDIELTLKFGVRFLDELNKVMGISQSNINIGMSALRAIPGLTLNDPSILGRVLYAASYSNPVRPTVDEWFDYLDTVTPSQITKLSKQCLDEINNSNGLKAMVAISKKKQG